VFHEQLGEGVVSVDGGEVQRSRVSLWMVKIASKTRRVCDTQRVCETAASNNHLF
jgi:hypothetical protein